MTRSHDNRFRFQGRQSRQHAFRRVSTQRGEQQNDPAFQIDVFPQGLDKPSHRVWIVGPVDDDSAPFMFKRFQSTGPTDVF